MKISIWFTVFSALTSAACDVTPDSAPDYVHVTTIGAIDQADDTCPGNDAAIVQQRVSASVKRAYAAVQGTWPGCRVDQDDGASPMRTVSVSCLDTGIVEGVITATTFTGIVRLGACYLETGEVFPHVIAFTAAIE